MGLAQFEVPQSDAGRQVVSFIYYDDLFTPLPGLVVIIRQKLLSIIFPYLAQGKVKPDEVRLIFGNEFLIIWV
jgi:hypothetical protein